ncbi:hypothetical protein D3C72_745330 [compost metagenome]
MSVDAIGQIAVHLEHLVDRHAAFIPDHAASLAACSHHEGGRLVGGGSQKGRFGRAGFHGLGAVGADAPHQPLRQHALQTGRHHVRRRAHLDHAPDGRGGVVGVERREHQVPGHGRLEGDVEGLLVANLADENHVRVQSQHAAQGRGEGQSDFGCHLNLADAVDGVLDGVFGREDVALGLVELVERRVERAGLAGARGPGDQDQPVGGLDHALPALERLAPQAQAGEARRRVQRPQEAQDHHLAPVGVDAGHAQIDRRAGDLDRHAPVLGPAALGDVEVRHHLEAADHGAFDLFGQRHDRLHDAVEAHFDEEPVVGGAQVQVARADVDGLGEDLVDQLDDRAFALRARGHLDHGLGGRGGPDDAAHLGGLLDQ